MIYLVDPRKKQYKANLHCHSTLSDGKKTPHQLKELYKTNGYSILAITDHEYPCHHNELTDGEFIMITGYESYIRPFHKYDSYEKEIHINFLAKDPYNEKMVCYDKRYIKYIPEEVREKLDKTGEENARVYSTEYINYMVRIAKENGYICTYNHPYWSMEDEDSILAYEGFCSMEMCNYSSYITNNLEYNAAIYDKLLLSGKRIACHSADDNHNKHEEGTPMFDSFGAFAVIMPDSFEYGSIMEAIEKGEMYSSMGPTFSEVSFNGKTIHVECSRVKQIAVFTGSKNPSFVNASKGEFLTKADIKIDERAKFVRISITDESGNHADTRGFFRNELGI